MSVAWVGAAASVVGSVASAKMQSGAAKDAADTSSEAANYSADLQKQMYDQTRADQSPWRNTGAASLNKLGSLLGLGTNSTQSAPQVESRADIYNRLKGQFTPAAAPTNNSGSGYGYYNGTPNTGENNTWFNEDWVPSGLYQNQQAAPAQQNPQTASEQFDYAGLNSAVDAELAKQQQAYDQFSKQQGETSDPAYGSLLKNYGWQDFNQEYGSNVDPASLTKNYGWQDFNQEYGSNVDPASLTKNFSLEDFQADPSYLFRQSEGEKGINRSLASRGRYVSGAALKELDRYNSDLASQEWGNAWNRDNAQKNRLSGIFTDAYNRDGTNKNRLSGLFTDAYNRYNTNNNNAFNRLSSVAGLGQTANNQLQSASQNYANNVSNLTMTSAANQGNALLSGANSQASGYAGLGNALGSYRRPNTTPNNNSTGYGGNPGYSWGGTNGAEDFSNGWNSSNYG